MRRHNRHSQAEATATEKAIAFRDQHLRRSPFEKDREQAITSTELLLSRSYGSSCREIQSRFQSCNNFRLPFFRNISVHSRHQHTVTNNNLDFPRFGLYHTQTSHHPSTGTCRRLHRTPLPPRPHRPFKSATAFGRSVWVAILGHWAE